MNITIICEVLGKQNNGTTVVSYNLINALKARGHKVTVVCPDEDKRGEEGFIILPKANFGRFMDWIFERNNLIMPRYDEEILTKAIEDADVVHIMIALFISRKTSTLVKRLGKPLTAGFHAQAENVTSQFGVVNSKLANKFVYHWLDKNVFCRADGIHYPTQFIRDVFEKEVGRTTPGYVISNGTNPAFKPMHAEKPDYLKDKFCILFTGRLASEKSHPVLIKAVAKSKYKDKIQLMFAGDGPKQKKLEKMGKKLPNPPIIKFYSRQDLNKLINYCDLYCHPAAMEIEGLSCIEAVSCGIVPIIANSPKCATKEFALDDRCLFKVNDSTDLAKKIDYFIEHPEEKDKLSKRYLEESKFYTQEYCMDQMEKMMIETVEKCKKN